MLNFTEKVVATIQVPKEITEEMIESVIVGAFEGGSNYWLGLNNTTEGWAERPRSEPSSTWATKMLLEGKTLHFYDREEYEETWTLTLSQLINGFALNAAYRPHDPCILEGDAITADCILQYGMFGKLVYG